MQYVAWMNASSPWCWLLMVGCVEMVNVTLTSSFAIFNIRSLSTHCWDKLLLLKFFIGSTILMHALKKNDGTALKTLIGTTE